MSAVKASRKWNVPRITLRDIKNGLYALAGKPGPSPVLTNTEEELLCEWLFELCRRGFPINKRCLLDSVQKIVFEDGRETPFTNNRPGEGWFQAYMKRHPQLAQRNAEAICRARGALMEGCIRGWFRDVEHFLLLSTCLIHIAPCDSIVDLDIHIYNATLKFGQHCTAIVIVVKQT